MDKDLQEYVKHNLIKQLQEIKSSKQHITIEELNEFEKSIIYYYSEDGFESLNEKLRDGEKIPELGKHLNNCLSKLPDYKLLCYRAIHCSNYELKRYYDAFVNNSIIVEKSFLSCSKSRLIALSFSNTPLFIIKSKKGKEIEKIAKFGIESGQNEKEILFMSGSKFRVLNFEEDDKDKTIRITLEEI